MVEEVSQGVCACVLGGGGGYKGSAENENDNPQDGHMPINDHEIPLK